MHKVNNKYGIKFYWEFANDTNKINILDSDGKYFNDFHYNADYPALDIERIICTLEDTNIRDLNNIFTNYPLFETLDELKEELDDYEITEDNEYLNIFKTKNKKYYTWSE